MNGPTGLFGIAAATVVSLGPALLPWLRGSFLADVLRGDVRSPAEVPVSSLADYDLVGFGSGVDYGRFHESLWAWVRGLPEQGLDQKPAFVFSTSGLSCLWKLWHGPFTKELTRRSLQCRGGIPLPWLRQLR